MVGKPPLSPEEVDVVFRKLEPYLKTGLSLNKSCLMANVPKTTAYDLYNENGLFAEKVDASKNYLSAITSSVIFNEVERIHNNQKADKPIDRDDLRLIQWLAMNHSSNKEEYGDDARDIQQTNQEKINGELDALANIIRDLRGS